MAAPPISSPLVPRHVVSGSMADLSLIYEPEVNLVLIRRFITTQVAGFVNRLLAGSWLIETEIRIAGEKFAAERLLPEAVQALPGAEAWLNDVEFLARLFHELFEPEAMGLRLRLLDHTMCPRFHADHVPVRMVCTYGGPGTEWLPEAALNRDRLRHRSGGLPDEASGLILDPGAVRRLPACAIGLLKGEKWPGNQGRGAVHRSPAPTSERPRRLLLTLDLL